MDAICIRAARALSIDYVGFDVLAQTKNDCVIIEANSGPILTEEAIDAFHELIGA
jgi:glutathione synthase/RimK-type ligase-like ATP-grasp enzyme